MFLANSDVLPSPSVAVAEMSVPTGTGGKGAVNLPFRLVFTVPRKVSPSPWPDGSPSELAKNSIVTVLGLGVSSVPFTTSRPGLAKAELSTGKFCRLFGPISVSPGSLGVTPSAFRSIPSLPLEYMELDRTVLLLVVMFATGRML